MARLFLLVATRRADLSDHEVGIRKTEAEALAARPALAAALARTDVRVMVRPADLDAAGIAAIIERWGREDKASGEPRAGLDDWPDHWRKVYLAAFHAAAAPAR